MSEYRVGNYQDLETARRKIDDIISRYNEKKRLDWERYYSDNANV